MFKISVSPEVSFLTILVFIIFSSRRECREYFRPLLRRAQFNLHIVKPAWHIVCFCPERDACKVFLKVAMGHTILQLVVYKYLFHN
uniref:Putative secreted protein n=1 Tax=Ixodes ricinus TaxID=34613 RepID=A0A6B0U977_IXORI